MDISSIAAATVRNTEDIGNLLKEISDSSAKFQEKLIKVNVAEELADDNLGQNIDMMA